MKMCRIGNVFSLAGFMKTLCFLIACVVGISSCTRELVDLRAVVKDISPLNPKVGDKVIVTYQVVNVGPSTVSPGAYTVRLEMDGDLLSFDNAGNSHPIQSGSAVEYKKKQGSGYRLTKSGEIPYKLTVKASLFFRDSNESNNTLSGLLKVQ